RSCERAGGAASGEADVVVAVHEALHALPALHQCEAFAQQVCVVDSTCRIEEMHRRQVALSALGRGETAHAADRDGARGEPALGEYAEHDVERDTVAAHDHEIRHGGGFADQSHARPCTGV